RDDGAVVYVNGVEVGRDNLPAGPIVPSTPSSSIISDRSAERTPVQITIPASAFKPGANVIAVEVHNSDRWSGDLSFDLKLTGQRSRPPGPRPPAEGRRFGPGGCGSGPAAPRPSSARRWNPTGRCR